MNKSFGSMVFSVLALGAILISGFPAFASAQSANCGWYGNTTNCGAGTVLVYMQVLNQNNGTSFTPSNFSVQVSGQNVSPSSFPGSQSGTLVSISGGSAYAVSVTPNSGFYASYSVGCSGTAYANQQATCVITMSGSGNNYPYPQPYQYANTLSTLTCSPAYQTVAMGQTATFMALGGGVGPYNWTTADRTYLSTGPVLNVALQTSGTQTVTVTAGSQIATCTVNVSTSGATSYPYYGQPGYTNQNLPPATLQYAYIPRLPNTGFAPVDMAGIAFALVILISAGIFFSPYVRKAFTAVIN